MSKILLTYVLPLLLPTVLYLSYMWFRGKRSRAKGDEPLPIASNSIFISLILGFILMISGLVYIAMTSGSPPDAGKYQSPRFEDGKIIPPTYTK